MPYLGRVLAERQGDKLLGESLPLAHGERGELGRVGVGHEGPSVWLVLYVYVRGELQPRHARIRALWQVCGRGGLLHLDGRRHGVVERGVIKTFGSKGEGGRQDVCSFVVRWRQHR